MDAAEQAPVIPVLPMGGGRWRPYTRQPEYIAGKTRAPTSNMVEGQDGDVSLNSDLQMCTKACVHTQEHMNVTYEHAHTHHMHNSVHF